jgi:hypothetical protein
MSFSLAHLFLGEQYLSIEIAIKLSLATLRLWHRLPEISKMEEHQKKAQNIDRFRR